jgi:hypothetical protein
MKKSLWIIAVLMSALMLAACGKKETNATTEAVAVEEAKAEVSPAAVPEETQEAVDAAKPAPNAAENPEAPKGIEDIAKALEKVRQVANNVKGDTPCERGYDGLIQVVAAMNVGGDKVPTKENYMAVCKTLPKAMQKCLDMSYGMKNVQECQKVREQTDPALLEKAKALMAE